MPEACVVVAETAHVTESALVFPIHAWADRAAMALLPRIKLYRLGFGDRRRLDDWVGEIAQYDRSVTAALLQAEQQRQAIRDAFGRLTR